MSILNKLRNTVARALVKLIDDSKAIQELQIEADAGGAMGDVERLQNYGFTSVPVDGAEAVAVCVGGRRDHAVIVAVDDRRYRVGNLESGEVCVYDKTGSKFLLKANGNIEVTPSSGELVFTGNLTVSGTLDVTGAATLASTLDVTGAADLGGTLDVTGVLTGSTINGTEISDGGKILGTHVHDVVIAGGSCSAGGASGGTVASAAPT